MDKSIALVLQSKAILRETRLVLESARRALERSQSRHRTDQDSLQEASAGPSGPFEGTEEQRC